jgi:asparagine synthase (glutamine-hydrolysing)
MNRLIEHRGPDGEGTWQSSDKSVGFVHRRLAIIDLSDTGAQPMHRNEALSIVFNGEIYNYKDLRATGELHGVQFASNSDTETILAEYERLESEFTTSLRGMFAIVIWDDKEKRAILARDRFGIKPLYYTVADEVLYFASEAKALLPFLSRIETDPEAFAEYITFQYTLGEKTLFKGIKQVLPGHQLIVKDGIIVDEMYWDVEYQVNNTPDEKFFAEKTRQLIHDSLDIHLTSDVEIGTYLSGGFDSSLISQLARTDLDQKTMKSFHGKFTEYEGYDESSFAEIVAANAEIDLHTIDITHKDFEENIRKVIYHLDFPTAGPGAFPQFMVSKLAAEHVKVVLGGQGADEIFGGYARYLIAYLEQCIRAAIDGTYENGNFVVTLESIIPNLGILQEYTPLLQSFWSEGLFGPLDERFLRLIDRSTDMQNEINWDELDKSTVENSFFEIFNSRKNVSETAYFDSMTHFEFKTLLPALLQVEDRMGMAHGLESRVPFLDHNLIEFVATAPANIKFKGGDMKHLLKSAFPDDVPVEITERRDKMGFPVPLKEWFAGPLKEFMVDTLSSMAKSHRPFINSEVLMDSLNSESKFSRKYWALLSLELWYQEFHDKEDYFKGLIK